jgi:hypothetical protein
MMPRDSSYIRLTGAEVDDNSVSADVLIRVLTGLKETIYVLGAAGEGRGIGSRFKPSAELRQRYQLRCGVQAQGSYVIPIAIGATHSQLPITFDGLTVEQRLNGLVQAVASNSSESLSTLLPDSRARNLALRKFETALPKPGERWGLGLSLRRNNEVVLDNHNARAIEQLVAMEEEPDTVMTVTGGLIRIDFVAYKIYILFPPTKREIECSYLPDIEDELIDNRRDFIQVTGNYILDEEGNPVRLTDVTRIETVDLSPMAFEGVSYNGVSLLIDPPLTINPYLDEDTKQLYVAVDDSIGLHAFAYTRALLADEISEQVVFLWQAYAQEDPEKLTEGAQKRRDVLRGRLHPVMYAA